MVTVLTTEPVTLQGYNTNNTPQTQLRLECTLSYFSHVSVCTDHSLCFVAVASCKCKCIRPDNMI